MARTDDVSRREQLKLIDKLAGKYSRKAIEDFFGIVIKEVDKKDYLYNIYMDGELVLPKVSKWVIEDVFRSLAARFANRLCNESTKEDDLKETERLFAEFEAEEIENERKNYYICPVCWAFVKRGTHFHM